MSEHDNEKDTELENLFERFDKEFEECQQKINAIEENLKTVRESQQEGEEPPAETAPDQQFSQDELPGADKA